ncbi:hypothetical protein WN944_003427 [Citrus x changshan-huyou]|uniref:Uncharacterized protein n=1 Tax=Citrus x changshan-huyou TaxID=2935761 RepID=A0AAP0QHZ4_9ROSI
MEYRATVARLLSSVSHNSQLTTHNSQLTGLAAWVLSFLQPSRFAAVRTQKLGFATVVCRNLYSQVHHSRSSQPRLLAVPNNDPGFYRRKLGFAVRHRRNSYSRVHDRRSLRFLQLQTTIQFAILSF